MELLRIEPIFKNRVWGGDLLGSLVSPSSRAGAALRTAQLRGPVGEAWLIADLGAAIAEGTSPIATGQFEGQAIGQLLRDPARRSSLMGRAACADLCGESAFPLLVKILDARENLSLQVHPDAKYAMAHPEAHLKEEVWLVLDAQPGARIYRGVDARVTREEFSRRLRDNTLLEAMISLPVSAGDSITIPSGVCHALGGGLLIAEVQTPSDTTFRVWDWGRSDPQRPLHLDQAIECTLLGEEQLLGANPVTRLTLGSPGGRIAIAPILRGTHFDVEVWEVPAGLTTRTSPCGVPVAWSVLQGSIDVDGLATPIEPCESIVLGASHTPRAIRGGPRGAKLLVSVLPDPLLAASQVGGIRTA